MFMSGKPMSGKPMSVEIQPTPNPNARKFCLPVPLFDAPMSFANVDVATEHPLATQLFALGTVYNVFMVRDFITINKLPAAPWEPLESAALSLITAYVAQHT